MGANISKEARDTEQLVVFSTGSYAWDEDKQEQQRGHDEVLGASPFGDDVEVAGYSAGMTRPDALATSFLRSLIQPSSGPAYGYPRWPARSTLGPHPVVHLPPTLTARLAVELVERPPQMCAACEAAFRSPSHWEAFEHNRWGLTPFECLPTNTFQRGWAEVERRYEKRQLEHVRQIELVQAAVGTQKSRGPKAHARIDKYHRQTAEMTASLACQRIGAESGQALKLHCSLHSDGACASFPVDSLPPGAIPSLLGETEARFSVQAEPSEAGNCATSSTKFWYSNSVQTWKFSPITDVRSNFLSACSSQTTFSESELAKSREQFSKLPIRTPDANSLLGRSGLSNNFHHRHNVITGAEQDEINWLWDTVYGEPAVQTNYQPSQSYSPPLQTWRRPCADTPQEHRALRNTSYQGRALSPSLPLPRDLRRVVAVGDMRRQAKRHNASSRHSQSVNFEQQEQQRIVYFSETNSWNVDAEAEVQPFLTLSNVQIVLQAQAGVPRRRGFMSWAFKYFDKLFRR